MNIDSHIPKTAHRAPRVDQWKNARAINRAAGPPGGIDWRPLLTHESGMVSARASQRLIKTFLPCLVCALCLAAPRVPAASITLEWNTGANEFVTRGGYARMKKLSTGEIALVFSSGDSVCIKKKSARAGAWGPAVRVASPAKESGYRYTNAEMCELADGRLCYTWNARPVRKDGHLPYKIMAAFSSDGGRTWGGARDLHVAGNTRRTGCWEPCPIQLPSGELQVWYADESERPIDMLTRGNGPEAKQKSTP